MKSLSLLILAACAIGALAGRGGGSRRSRGNGHYHNRAMSGESNERDHSWSREDDFEMKAMARHTSKQGKMAHHLPESMSSEDFDFKPARHAAKNPKPKHNKKQHESGSSYESMEIKATKKKSGSKELEQPKADDHKSIKAQHGREQSPINIESNAISVGFDRLLKPLEFNYKSTDSFLLKNNGQGFIVDFGEKCMSTLSGGPLKEPYNLAKIAVHWGTDSRQGSEHLIDGKGFAAEIQLIHYNYAKYGNMKSAMTHGDGLAIVSVFLELGKKCDEKNEALATLVKYLPFIARPFDKIKLIEPMRLKDLLPKNRSDYWTYNGSMTQAPFLQNAIWLILKDTVTFSENHLTAFRAIYPANNRPVRPLYDRVVRRSFRKSLPGLPSAMERS